MVFANGGAHAPSPPALSLRAGERSRVLETLMHHITDLAAYVRSHRCSSHPLFEHWATVAPEPTVIGALFHQIRSFCDATRPGGRMPEALRRHGLDDQSLLLQEIVDSEENHGPALATMAGHIVNRAAGRELCPDLSDQHRVEALLEECSDRLLAALPGYDHRTGLTVQCRAARAVFARRDAEDRETTIRNLGTAVALEMVSHRHLIPGEKRALVDSELYAVRMTDPEMHYLEEHWGEVGAEAHHERNALEAVGSLLDAETAPLLFEGARDFLETLAGLWDVLDAALLHSGLPALPDPGLPIGAAVAS